MRSSEVIVGAPGVDWSICVILYGTKVLFHALSVNTTALEGSFSEYLNSLASGFPGTVDQAGGKLIGISQPLQLSTHVIRTITSLVVQAGPAGV